MELQIDSSIEFNFVRHDFVILPVAERMIRLLPINTPITKIIDSILLTMSDVALPQKMPRFMKHVKQQISNHPDFKTLDVSTRFSAEACIMGYTRCGPDDNKFLRKVWKKLYWGEEIDENLVDKIKVENIHGSER